MIGPTTGVQLHGADLRVPLSQLDVDVLRSLLDTHKLLVFRDQRLDTSQYVAFCRNFGSLISFPSVLPNHPTTPGVHLVHNRDRTPEPDDAGSWHLDASSLVTAPDYSELRAVQVPPVGGDTVFSNLVDCYRRLSPAVKESIEDLYTTHMARRRPIDRQNYPAVVRSLVQEHPRTGERHLYVCFMLDPVVVGWDRSSSADLVRVLLAEATRPECQVRLSWSAGDVALWDNRVLLHYGVRDYGDSPRELERVLVTARPQDFVEELI
ncbi:hypothetical protein ACG83_02070 [Frankia sp. R43]|nr:hypothetical protein ACG83_02070 [Frankia sp. R43]